MRREVYPARYESSVTRTRRGDERPVGGWRWREVRGGGVIEVERDPRSIL